AATARHLHLVGTAFVGNVQDAQATGEPAPEPHGTQGGEKRAECGDCKGRHLLVIRNTPPSLALHATAGAVREPSPAPGVLPYSSVMRPRFCSSVAAPMPFTSRSSSMLEKAPCISR